MVLTEIEPVTLMLPGPCSNQLNINIHLRCDSKQRSLPSWEQTAHLSQPENYQIRNRTKWKENTIPAEHNSKKECHQPPSLLVIPVLLGDHNYCGQTWHNTVWRPWCQHAHTPPCLSFLHEIVLKTKNIKHTSLVIKSHCLSPS